MNRLLALILCLLIMTIMGCTGTEHKPARKTSDRNSAKQDVVVPERSTKLAFKGMELYSWKPDGDEWHFSLLFGTNRTKGLLEIIDPMRDIIGVESLKLKLSELAEGEHVSWCDVPGDSESEPLPKEMVEDLTRYCSSLKIELHRY